MEVAERRPILLPITSPRGTLLHPLRRLRPADLAAVARFWMGCWRTTNSRLRITRRRFRSAPKVVAELRLHPLRSRRFLARSHRRFPHLAARGVAELRRLPARRVLRLYRNVQPKAEAVQLRLPHPAHEALQIPPAALARAAQAAEPRLGCCSRRDLQSRAKCLATMVEAPPHWESRDRAACDPRQFPAHRPEERLCRLAAILPVPLFFRWCRAGEPPPN
jgi:hypothetical protein